MSLSFLTTSIPLQVFDYIESHFVHIWNSCSISHRIRTTLFMLLFQIKTSTARKVQYSAFLQRLPPVRVLYLQLKSIHYFRAAIDTVCTEQLRKFVFNWNWHRFWSCWSFHFIATLPDCLRCPDMSTRKSSVEALDDFNSRHYGEHCRSRSNRVEIEHEIINFPWEYRRRIFRSCEKSYYPRFWGQARRSCSEDTQRFIWDGYDIFFHPGGV